MKTLKSLCTYNPKAFYSIILSAFVATLIEALATQYMPILIIWSTGQSKYVLLLLILCAFALCLLDLFASPILRKKATLKSAEFIESFRNKNVEYYIESCLDDNPDLYHNSLILATEHVESFLKDNVSQIAYRLIYGIGSLISLLLISPLFVAILLILGGVIYAIRAYYQPRINKLFSQRIAARKELMLHYGYVLNNQFFYSDYNVLMRSNALFARWDTEYTSKTIKHAITRGRMQLIFFLMSELILIVAVLGIYLNILKNASVILTIRPVINFFNYLGITITSTTENIEVISRFLRSSIFRESQINESKQLRVPSQSATKRGIYINNVTFSYDKHNVLKNFSYTFQYGQIYEIRGPRGTGKSTLLKLIGNRIYPQSGTIIVDGIPNILGSINKHIFYLSPNTEPFLLSLEDNILLGKEKNNRFFEIIEQMNIPKHNIQSCRNLSAGEKVRVALARGLISNKEIFLLDEFNANLDAQSEKQIIDLLQELTASGALIIVVNHKTRIPNATSLIMGGITDGEELS